MDKRQERGKYRKRKGNFGERDLFSRGVALQRGDPLAWRDKRGKIRKKKKVRREEKGFFFWKVQPRDGVSSFKYSRTRIWIHTLSFLHVSDGIMFFPQKDMFFPFGLLDERSFFFFFDEKKVEEEERKTLFSFSSNKWYINTRDNKFIRSDRWSNFD